MDGIHDTPDTTHTTFWPDVRNYLQCKDRIKPGKKPPVVICALCQDAKLDILGLPLSDEAVSSTKPAMVLICGHMACRTCFELWYRACFRAREEQKTTCPFCRHELKFKCGHTILGFTMPTTKDNSRKFPNFTAYLDDVPLTLPEGGKQPDKCNGCQRLHLTNRSMTGAYSFVEKRAGIVGQLFAFDFHSTIQKGLLENIAAQEHDEHPSWATQWDHHELRPW